MIFMCFSVKDRKAIVEPIVYQLTNYGFDVWYDRAKTAIGDDRSTKNFVEGVQGNAYATVVMSRNYSVSNTMKTELKMLKSLYECGKVTVFPILYEMKPSEIPADALWLKDIVFAECTRSTGTREICNNIACKISEDLLTDKDALPLEHCMEQLADSADPSVICMKNLLQDYADMDDANFVARVTLLYAVHRVAEACSENAMGACQLASRSFARVFSEAKLNLKVSIRELRFLENVLCLEINGLGKRFV